VAVSSAFGHLAPSSLTGSVKSGWVGGRPDAYRWSRYCAQIPAAFSWDCGGSTALSAEYAVS
jgi:hypothetical protein